MFNLIFPQLEKLHYLWGTLPLFLLLAMLLVDCFNSRGCGQW